MLSAEDIAAVKVAVKTCNNPELKREILCAPGSDYYINKTSYEVTNKKQWDEIIKKKSTIILENLGLPAKLQEKVTGLVLLVGMRILTWAEYHEITLGFSRDYSMNCLNCSFFTCQGIVDNKKVAEELMNDKNLTIKQKYKLACLYFTDHISDLYRQMANEDKEEFYDAQNPARIKQPRWVKFWSYYLMGEIDKLREDKNFSLYRLEKAIESGSKVAVEYCLEKTNLSRKKDDVIDAAVESVRNWARSETRDWVAFRPYRYGSNETWVPSDYYVDILCFLLSKMRDYEKIVFLKKDIEDVKHKIKLSFNDRRSSRVLRCFLKWPYQDYFMYTAKLIWEFLPERDYAALLLGMCDKIETEYGALDYGEDRSYDYRGLLKEFWCQGPEHFKRYIFSNQNAHTITYEAGAAVELLFKLLTLRKFTHEDRQNINLILESADDEEKENIKCSGKWRYICCDLIKEEKFESMNRFLLNWFSTKEEAEKFKVKLSMNYHICIDFVKKNRRSAAESCIRWFASSDEEINKLKKEMIYSPYGKEVCRNLISVTRGLNASNKFCEWFFSSEEEFGEFKKEFFLLNSEYCIIFALEDKIEVADKFIKWCFSSEEESNKIKKDLAYKRGDHVCEELISRHSVEGIFNEEGNFTGDHTIKFKGGKWEQVEKFLTWCFSSEKEISDFKKNVLFGDQSLQIHFNLIICNRWEEAEMYFAWLGLSAEEIKELKKDTLFSHHEASRMFSELMYSEEGDNYYEYVDYGGKKEAIELLLRWHLTDKETVLQFKDEFECYYRGRECEVLKAMFENFDLMIEQRLNDLDEEQKGVKRKAGIFSPNKKLYNVELENNGIEYDI